MYAEWSSLPLEGGGRGVLGAVGGGAGAGRDVVLAVVRQLASHEPSPLTTDAEVSGCYAALVQQAPTNPDRSLPMPVSKC